MWWLEVDRDYDLFRFLSIKKWNKNLTWCEPVQIISSGGATFGLEAMGDNGPNWTELVLRHTSLAQSYGRTNLYLCPPMVLDSILWLVILMDLKPSRPRVYDPIHFFFKIIKLVWNSHFFQVWVWLILK